LPSSSTDFEPKKKQTPVERGREIKKKPGKGQKRAVNDGEEKKLIQKSNNIS